MPRSSTAQRKPSNSHAGSRRTSSSPRPARAKDVSGAGDYAAFFDRLTTCLTSGDGEGAAACFEYPSLMVMSSVGEYTGAQALPDPATVAAFFAKAPEQYNSRGISQTFALIESVEPLPGDLALVQCRFPYIDADGNDMGDGETSLYVVRGAGRACKICCAITLGVDSDRTD